MSYLFKIAMFFHGGVCCFKITLLGLLIKLSQQKNMNKTDGQQLNFNFLNNIKEVIPEDITLDELLYVLKHHRNSMNFPTRTL